MVVPGSGFRGNSVGWGSGLVVVEQKFFFAREKFLLYGKNFRPGKKFRKKFLRKFSGKILHREKFFEKNIFLKKVSKSDTFWRNSKKL
jgi:hypothetical protein